MNLKDNGYTPPDSFDAHERFHAPPKPMNEIRDEVAAKIFQREFGTPTPDQILAAMAKTFEERGKIYGDNWKRIGDVLHALAGGKPVTISGPEEWLRWSLHMMIVTKITRLATTDLTHQDSAHDAAVYAAMLETIQKEQHHG